MGKLKPIGSEKLEGIEKIHRIMEIARYKENIPNSINEVNSNQYNIKLVDGNTYHIEREKNGYVIKKSINEGRLEYLEPMKHRKYYQSYSQAFKRLNLIVKEINENYGNDNHISLFNEDKKFVLKTPKSETPNPPSAPPPPAAAPPPPAAEPSQPPSPEPASSPDMGTEDEPMDDENMGGEDEPMGDENMGGEDEPMGDEDMGGEDVGGDEESSDSDSGVVSFKTIQKLTGKLGQKLRKMSQGEDGLSADDTKYVINSILSALDLSVLEDEDVEEIIGRLEDSEFESDEEPTDDEEEPTGDEELPTDDEESTPPSDDDELPEMEMREYETNEYIEGMIDGDYDLGFSDKPKYPQRNGYFTKLKNRMGDMMEDDEYEGVSKIFDSVFSESKVDNIIKSYFVETEKEKQFIQEKKKEKFLIEKARKTKTMNEVRNLSESYRQEQISSKFLDRFTKAQFVGKTNKKNLVFEVNGKQYKITPDGAIL